MPGGSARTACRYSRPASSAEAPRRAGRARAPDGRRATAPSGQRWVPLGQLADVKIVSGPPMVRDEDGLLVGYVFVDIDQAQRDIGGYVDDAKSAVQGGDRARRALALPAWLLPLVDRPVRADGADDRAHEARHPADPRHHRPLAVAAVQERHRGADRPPLDPVRAGRQRLADVAARLPRLDRRVGRGDRARRPRRADRHRDDRVHRSRLRAAEARRQDPRPRRHHLGAHGGHAVPVACGPS